MIEIERNHYWKGYSRYHEAVISILSVSILISSIALSSKADESVPLATREGERIVIIGGGFAERLQYFGYFETLLAYHASAQAPVIRNMAWNADEVALMPRSYNFIRSAEVGEPDDPSPRGYGDAFEPDSEHRILSAHLKARKADTILLCFGATEAFKGEDGLAEFSSNYQLLIERLRGQKFNGESPPRLILVSPIAQENLGGAYPDPAERNDNLKRYAQKIGEIAGTNNLHFVDIFTPSLGEINRERNDDAMTIDGLQLNDHGQQIVAEALARGLGITDPWSESMEGLRELVIEKNKQFFFRWRPINGEYVYGRRREPFGIVSFPPEMAQLDEIIDELDQNIHAEAKKLNSLP